MVIKHAQPLKIPADQNINLQRRISAPHRFCPHHFLLLQHRWLPKRPRVYYSGAAGNSSMHLQSAIMHDVSAAKDVILNLIHKFWRKYEPLYIYFSFHFLFLLIYSFLLLVRNLSQNLYYGATHIIFYYKHVFISPLS